MVVFSCPQNAKRVSLFTSVNSCDIYAYFSFFATHYNQGGNMIIANIIAFIIILIGAVNWGLVGIFDFNLVSAIFGSGQNLGSSFVYVLVFISALWLILASILDKGVIKLCNKNDK